MEYITDEIKQRLYGFLISFRAEIVLITISMLILVSSLIVFTVQARQPKISSVTPAQPPVMKEKNTEKFIYVDIAGAVEYPDVYKISEGTRVKALIDKAGGVSSQADTAQIAQTMNMSSVLSDQQKIYIPSVGDVFEVASTSETKQADSKISINTAGTDELNTLDGVGEVTAKKIVAGRPYNAVSDLLSKKIVGKSLYDKIKDWVVL